MVKIEHADPRSAESQWLIEKLSAELAAITGDGGNSRASVDTLQGEGALWVIARDAQGSAVGCGALRPLAPGIAELKSMFSDRSLPGIGRALLAFLETAAKTLGYRELWLETRHVNQRAVDFYLKQGYRQIENYGPYRGREEAICLGKTL
ncbi:GNAT family N-acetyltransferase [Pantoea dispersa]|uniref:GNAT family N-acetyltransferase n=1 Tax=Pantoea dispersa TaxID=59814 RepID=UPI0032EC7B8A